MIGRHIIFAGLFAAASVANAGTVEASSATIQPATSFNSGMTAAAAPAAFQAMMAGPGALSTHARRGDVEMNAMTLFSQPGAGPAPAQFASTIEAPAAADLPAVVVNADVVLGADAIAAAAIPEPATGMLMLAGLLGAGFMSRRRK